MILQKIMPKEIVVKKVQHFFVIKKNSISEKHTRNTTNSIKHAPYNFIAFLNTNRSLDKNAEKKNLSWKYWLFLNLRETYKKYNHKH